MTESTNLSIDLNQNALNEFIKLVQQDSDLTAEWKTNLLQIVSDGFPVDYSSLTTLIEGGEQTGVSPENLEG